MNNPNSLSKQLLFAGTIFGVPYAVKYASLFTQSLDFKVLLAGLFGIILITFVGVNYIPERFARFWPQLLGITIVPTVAVAALAFIFGGFIFKLFPTTLELRQLLLLGSISWLYAQIAIRVLSSRSR
ncbi:hypothetical protein KAZ57_04000 [Patescibacteria group bacterium]|nr:hypothetical protein [Patescibacteria group bacterium]